MPHPFGAKSPPKSWPSFGGLPLLQCHSTECRGSSLGPPRVILLNVILPGVILLSVIWQSGITLGVIL
jgi:hypothetical protein